MDGPQQAEREKTNRSFKPRQQKRRSKTNPFNRETREAQKRREETEKRAQAREQSEAQRKKKLEDRERMRKAVAKARKPGKDGKRRLGRESHVLLEKVKKLVGEGG